MQIYIFLIAISCCVNAVLAANTTSIALVGNEYRSGTFSGTCMLPQDKKENINNSDSPTILSDHIWIISSYIRSIVECIPIGSGTSLKKSHDTVEVSNENCTVPPNLEQYEDNTDESYFRNYLEYYLAEMELIIFLPLSKTSQGINSDSYFTSSPKKYNTSLFYGILILSSYWLHFIYLAILHHLLATVCKINHLKSVSAMLMVGRNLFVTSSVTILSISYVLDYWQIFMLSLAQVLYLLFSPGKIFHEWNRSLTLHSSVELNLNQGSDSDQLENNSDNTEESNSNPVEEDNLSLTPDQLNNELDQVEVNSEPVMVVSTCDLKPDYPVRRLIRKTELPLRSCIVPSFNPQSRSNRSLIVPAYNRRTTAIRHSLSSPVTETDIYRRDSNTFYLWVSVLAEKNN